MSAYSFASQGFTEFASCVASSEDSGGTENPLGSSWFLFEFSILGSYLSSILGMRNQLFFFYEVLTLLEAAKRLLSCTCGHVWTGGSGGGFYISSGSGTIQQSRGRMRLTNCTAEQRGGGFYLGSTVPGDMSNTRGWREGLRSP